ncbi:hypothetical protein Tco_0187925 [Tanacetum coccineum]
MQDQVRAGVIPYKTDQDILDEVVPSTNRQNMSGKDRKLPGGGSTSRRRGPQAFPNVISREELVSLNLLSRTRKLGHSTMELRSLIS